ncbi:histidine phosphatase family protein [Paenibacillus mesophilus]|uniref:histidine phosphatase family protein n=1 Tax=Paenibacillus mesophilus TaxID=2582849 RepID=UPI00110E698C|nr:histidine phosphatase family protein [Paenibacillus mesophilus]TMV50665.1 histidine phosphatase family protein [Paenibacillus mesophilus]
MKIYLIRHAEPDYPNQTITAAGHLEAQALAGHLREVGVDRIYCSPINRAVHTMQYTADLLGMEPVFEPWTRELGWQATDEEGRPIAAWNIPGESVRARKPYPGHETWPDHASYRDYAALYETIKNDSDAFLQRHGYAREEGRYRIEAPNREAIAVFCHLGFGLTWLSHLLELPFPLVWSAFWLPPSSVTTILFEQRSEQWAVPRCTGLGCVSHLHKAGLPVSSMGLMANNV